MIHELLSPGDARLIIIIRLVNSQVCGSNEAFPCIYMSLLYRVHPQIRDALVPSKTKESKAESKYSGTPLIRTPVCLLNFVLVNGVSSF